MQGVYTHSTKTSSWKNLTLNNSVLNSRSESELSNHLGNVLSTVSDRKVWNSTDSHYEAVVTMYADYYAFGMMQPNRFDATAVADTRHLFNGMEHDGEVSGSGNSYTTEFRQYDPRLGRWKSLDPLMSLFPNMSPYVAFANNPVFFTDPYGLAPTNDGGGDDDIVDQGYTEEVTITASRSSKIEGNRTKVILKEGRFAGKDYDEWRRTYTAYEHSRKMIGENGYSVNDHLRNYRENDWINVDPATAKFNEVIEYSNTYTGISKSWNDFINFLGELEDKYFNDQNKYSIDEDSFVPKDTPAQTDVLDGNTNPVTGKGQVDETVGGGGSSNNGSKIKKVDYKKVYDVYTEHVSDSNAVYPYSATRSVRWNQNKDMIDTIIIFRKSIIDTIILINNKEIYNTMN